MPPKKKGKKGKKAPRPPTPPPEPELHFSDEEEESPQELDLINDLNDDFFSRANKTIQNLMQVNRVYEATKLKKFVTIIQKLHHKYVEEVRTTESLYPQVERAKEKLRIAFELTLTSGESMELIRQQLAYAWQENDATLMREQIVQEKLQDLLMKVEDMEEKEDKDTNDEAEFGQLAKYKNIILRERDRLNGEVVELEKRLALQRYYAESLEYMNKNSDETIGKLQNEVRQMEAEGGNMKVKLRNLINNLEDQKDVNSKTVAKLDLTAHQLHEAHASLSRQAEDIDKKKVLIEKMRGEALVSKHAMQKLEDDLAIARRVQKDNEETMRALRLEDKVKSNTIHMLNKKNKKIAQDYSNISSKLYKMNRMKNLMADDITRLKNEINVHEKNLITSVGKYDDLRRIKDNIQRERDGLRHDAAKLANNIADLKHTIMIQVNNIDGLHMDVNKLNIRLDESKIFIAKISHERDEIAQEMQTLQEQIENLKDTLIMKNDMIVDLTEKLNKSNYSLNNVRKQLEEIHSEKMMLKRSLEVCTQERDNFRNLQAKVNHQIMQLTNEIAYSHNKIASLNLNIDRLKTDKKELQSDLLNREKQVQKLNNDLKELMAKNLALVKTIDDDEKKFMKMSTSLDNTRKEKNLIGLQMVRRNDEIVLLKEKLSITQTALDHGQAQYNQRIEDIKLLKAEIRNLQNERDCLSRALKSTADMRQEILRLQRALNQERIKVRSLTEDAKTPTGVHRWRILKGEDPNKYQLIEKVQLLQRRNLKQEIEKANLQRQLGESVRICDNLKRVVEHLPGQDIKRKLVVQQRINRQQLKKMKALGAELAIDEIELKARECIITQFKEALRACNDGTNGSQLDELIPDTQTVGSSDGACKCPTNMPPGIFDNISVSSDLSQTLSR